MSIVKEFKEFAVKGNVVDLAVGVIIGGAFGFKDIKITLKEAVGKTPAVAINIGSFINAAIDFIIVAFVIFLMIKGINAMKRSEEAAPEPEVASEPTKEELLLTEIRDLLAKKA